MSIAHIGRTAWRAIDRSADAFAAYIESHTWAALLFAAVCMVAASIVDVR
jgi:hypothetical protein